MSPSPVCPLSTARLLIRLALAASLSLSLSLPAQAAIDTVTGATGTAGTAGTAGNPGTAGGPGGPGDPASANATTVNSDASNNATASGGAGGNGGIGGTGTPANSDSGDGGDGGDGGNADATADTTVNSGSGTANATANGGFGGSGGAPGTVSGTGTQGTGGTGGNAGTATVTANVTNTGSGSASATGTANGRTGGSGGANGGGSGNGGVASLGAVSASSVSGTVNATGAANGGNGGTANGGGSAGDGAIGSATNAVTGSTSGTLNLTQNVTGGNSGSTDTGTNGTAGTAFSSLSKDTGGDANQASSLFVDTNAFGGNGGERDDTNTASQAADGATGTAISSATSGSGSARAQTDARGGTGGIGRNGADGGDGGDSFSTTTATTSGDGNRVDADGFAGFASNDGGGVSAGLAGSRGGDGGDATGNTTGTAIGDSIVDARDDSDGGDGGAVSSGTGSGGNGGLAVSQATGSNNGTSTVTVVTNGRGGNGGAGREAGESGGTGGSGLVTTATGTSTSGTVNVTGTASGGTGGTGNTGASGGNGGNGSINNALSGSTSGTLNLTQTSTGGAGGSANGGGTAGDAGFGDGLLNASNAGGNLNVTVTSNGGNGGAGTTGSSAGNGGAATFGVGPGTVSGASTAGAVAVTATGNGGNGGSAADSGNAGGGATVSLTDTVDGSTSGSLTLTQNATGGASGAVDNGLNGTAGNAFSSLSHDTAGDANLAASLFVDTDAFGGNGGERDDVSGAGASGGNGTAISSATSASGSARAQTDARGGTGGLGRDGADGGDGGDATSTSTATTAGDGNAIDVDGRAGVFGGASGGGITNGAGNQAGAGGTAVGTSTGTATGNSLVNVNDDADGGFGGSVSSGTGSGGDGGSASSSATGSNAGASSVTVAANGRGGNGGTGRGAGESGGLGGDGTVVTADGSSTGGGNVSVSGTATGGTGGAGSAGADGGDGGDGLVNNALSGSTSGTLTLSQTSTGGAGGASDSGGGSGGAGGAGGLGDATLSGNNTGGGSLNAFATANGGTGGAGNNGSDAGNGGTATLGVGTGTVSGSSAAGGSVQVFGTANGGDGGAANGSGNAGDGASVSMTDKLTGSTSGSLTLNQNVSGGNSGTVDSGLSGVAGSAFSDLTYDATLGATKPSALTVATDGLGGAGGARDAAGGQAAAGAIGTSNATAINDGGSARADTNGVGGFGGTGSNGANGGDAGTSFANAHAETFGIGNTADANGSAGVFANNDGGDVNSGNASTGGRGGDATSTSTALAHGDSSADANDDANGGRGGDVNSGTGSGGRGGDASSTATASNAPGSTASVTAIADGRGGVGGNGRGATEAAGVGGDGTAVASADGGAGTSVTATALGGNGGSVFDGAANALGGNAFATATATGASGTAFANAFIGTSTGNLVNDLNTTASASVGSTSVAQASAEVSGAGSGYDPTAYAANQATSVGYAAPADTVSLPVVLGNAVHANFDISGTEGAHTVNDSGQFDSDTFGVGVLGGSYSVNGSGSARTYTSTANYDVDVTQFQASSQNLLVGFAAPDIAGTAFTDPNFSVRGTVTVEGVTLLDSGVLTTEAAARAFFDNATHDLGSIAGITINGDLDVDLNLSVTADDIGSGFNVNYIVGNSDVTQRAVPFVPTTDFDAGDRHVGDAVALGVEVQNVAVAGSDGANAAFTGTTGDSINNGGTISNLAPQASDNSSLTVGIDTTTSGVKSGTTTIELETDGVVSGTQEVFGTTDVTTGGTVYNFAAATVNNAPVVLANVREGATSEQALSITNSAPNDGFTENLNAAGNGTTGDATVAGSFTGLGAQATDTTNVVVGIDTATAGAKAGTATVDFVSDGTGINSLGQTALASQQVNVSGNVFRLAEAGAHTPEPVVLADSHVGDTAEQALSLTNTAANDGFSESLNASIGAATGNATTNGGSFNLLAAQATDNSNLVVGIDTSSAGAKAGTATITSESDGTGTSGITPNVALANQTVNVSGDVFRLASASAHSPEPVVLADSHVGDTAQQALTLGNTATADGFSENLNASFGATTGQATASGSFTGLAAGGSDNSSLLVGIDTSAAGARSGSVALNLESDGTGINTLGQTALAGQTVNVSGDVFNLAAASAHSPEPVNLGNVHVGDTATQALTLGNTAAAGAFSENLNASFTPVLGPITATGTITGLAAGGSDNSSLVVGIDTASAGARNGAVGLVLESDGTGINSLGQTALAGQTVNVSGNVFRLADAQIDNPLAFAFGNVQVGDTVNQAVSITNNVANDGFSEGLNAGFGAASDARITNNAGSFNLLGAGGTDAASLVVGIDTSVAGNVSGTQTLNFVSDGTGTSGLGTTNLADQDLNVSASISASVFRLANPVINNTQPLAFGNFREGDTVTAQALSVTNDVPNDGFSEALDAQAAGTTGGVTNNGGSFTLLGPTATDNASITVAIDTSTAGDKAGNQTVDFQSNGAGSSGLGITPLASQDVAVTGQVFRLAAAGAHTPEPVVLADSHVGDTAEQALSLSNTAANDGFSESLNASIGAATGDATASGSFNLLAAQATDNSSLVVGIDTSTAGAKSGTATISSESDGTGTSGITPNVALADQTVNVSGDVYNLAAASAHSPEPVDLGNVHVGDTATQALTLGNIAAAGAFSENLNASFGAATGDATATGSISGLAAGGSDNSSLVVGINTATAGAKAGTAALNLESDGDGINSLGQTALSGQTVNVSGNVFRLADAQIDNPLAFAFGNVQVGDSVSQAVSITNNVANDGFSEGLNAGFGAASDARITNNAGSFNLLGAGATDNSSLVVGIDTSVAGNVIGTQTLNFVSDGTGTSGLGTTNLADQDLNVSASISASVFRLANPVINNGQPLAFGNFREGDAVSAQALSITNDVPNDGFSEALDAQAAGTTGGVTNNGGSFTLLGPSATDNTSITVAIDTSTAGDKGGNQTVDFQSNGAGSSGLGITPLASQDVAVTGQVFRLAEAGAHTPEPVVLADSHVGDTAQQALSMTNTAASDGFSESLNASIGAATGNATTNSGSFNLLAAQATDNSSLVVGIDTSTAGAKAGTATITSESDGTGTSGITPNVALADQTVNVSGNVYNLAAASAHSPEPVNLGNVHVGDTAEQALTLGNTAAASAFSENLNASFDAATGDATAAGSISGLAAGGSDNSSLVVGINTATAGAKVGTAALNLESDGDGINSLGQTALAGQTVNVSGNVFRLAAAQVTPDPVTLNARIGDMVSQTLTVANTAANDGFSEGLAVTSGSASGDAGLSGMIGGLIAAGGSDTNLSASLDTSSAGVKSGSIDFTFASDGTGTSGLGTTGLSPGSVTVQGNVYQVAVAAVDTTPIDFGIVHVGDVVTLQNIAVSNTAAAVALNDTLTGGVSAVDGPFTGSGNLGSGVAAGGTDNSNINVGLGTATSGVFNGNATLSLASSDPDLADFDLGDFGVALTGQVNEFADPVFDFISGDGSLTGSGFGFQLDLGDIVQGGTRQTSLRVLNDVVGLADLLDGDFLLSGGFFDLIDFDPFANLAAGAGSNPLLVGLDTTSLSLGLVTGSVILQANGHNASGFSQNFGDITLSLRANIVQQGGSVPEPPTLLIMLLAGGLMLRQGRRRRARTESL